MNDEWIKEFFTISFYHLPYSPTYQPYSKFSNEFQGDIHFLP